MSTRQMTRKSRKLNRKSIILIECVPKLECCCWRCLGIEFGALFFTIEMTSSLAG